MSTISPVLGEEYSIESQQKTKFNKELGQDEFLELMMAQLKHQDPMKPMDNGEFLGQMAQFSTVTGIDEMKESIDTLSQTYASSQTLQSSQLVGKEILIESSKLALETSGEASGVFELENSAGNVQMTITNQSGEVVRQQDIGEFPPGRHEFSWDGRNDKRDRAPAGSYNVSITSKFEDTVTSATTMATRVIDSVEFGNAADTRINTRQGESLSLSDIRQIRQSSAESEI